MLNLMSETGVSWLNIYQKTRFQNPTKQDLYFLDAEVAISLYGDQSNQGTFVSTVSMLALGAPTGTGVFFQERRGGVVKLP
jgi:hypothetical protein